MKIKLIVFDLDGVLVDSRPLHYNALNMALEKIDSKYIITENEHLSKYDGNPTTVKLNMLDHHYSYLMVKLTKINMLLS